MFLLKKREVDARKAQERQREMDEGAKLARTVDSLRELRAEEETRFSKWRETTLKDIQADIKSKSDERDAVIQEITKLEQRKKLALATLDTEWEKVSKQEVLNKSGKESNDAVSADLQLAIAANIRRERANEVETGRIAEERHRTSKELIAAAKDHESASSVLDEANNRSSVMNAALALREKELATEERKARDMLWKAEETLKKVEVYEISLAKREVALRTGWKSLENTKKKSI